MERIKYGVIVDRIYSMNNCETAEKKFNKWHSSKEEAIQEAERLCRKEQCAVFIVKLVGIIQVDSIPLKKEVWD